MKIEPRQQEQFTSASAKPMRAEDLFLPSVIDIVKHIARMAAEQDYKQYVVTEKTPYAVLEIEEAGHD